MKLHLPCLLRRAVVRALFAAATVVTTLASATHADMITPDGRTATQVIQSGSVYDVYTNTVRGNTGFNSFSTFDVYAETTANLHLADGTGKLINVVRDSSSHIDGVLNSYKDGSIGGDVYFLNPNGIIVGKTGIINVGSISMSTPTAAFVEQLIARDGSISATATQAVLAGDMPINEKGTISIKGKVNSAGNVELRAGKAEVPEGKVRTGVKFGEMVNTGNRKVDTQGMSIQNGKLSFGATPAQESRVAETETETAAETAVQETGETVETEETPGISIFANEVLVNGSALETRSVYSEQDVLRITGTLSDNYTAEAREIIVEGAKSDNLTSFTLTAANELSDGTKPGPVSITFTNSNIEANEVSVTAAASSNAADATISITGSTIKASREAGTLDIYAVSLSGNARVNVQGSTLDGVGSVEIAAQSAQGNAAITLAETASATGAIVSLEAASFYGDAEVSVQGEITGGDDVSITAATGSLVSDSDVDDNKPVSEMEFTPEGGGNAKATVAGKVKSGRALAVSAVAMGTYGDAAVDIAESATLDSTGFEKKTVGNLEFERSDDLTVKEDDSEDEINRKNEQYLKDYLEYLQGLDSAYAATGTIDITAASTAGNASVTLNALGLAASLGADISAEAAKAASVQLNGYISGGDITVAAQGDTSTLRVAESATLQADAHEMFVQDGLVASVEKSDGVITLAAGTQDGDEPDITQVAGKTGSALLEVAGTLTSSRETRGDSGDAGAIFLFSAGKLTVGENARVEATSTQGEGGIIYLEAPQYELIDRAYCFNVEGGSGEGDIVLMNPEELTGDNINNADEVSQAFITKTLGLDLPDADTGGSWNWKGGFSRVSLSGKIDLQSDVTATIGSSLIQKGTVINCHTHSLTLTNAYRNHWESGRTITIGDNVQILNAENFTLDWNYESVRECFLGGYFGPPTRVTVGSDFTVQATGDVTIKVAGLYNTAISFGPRVNIASSGGAVTIKATTRNGQGANLFASSKMALFPKVVKLIPGITDTDGAKIINQLGIIKFDTDKFFKLAAKHLCKKFGIDGKNIDEKTLHMPQMGVRYSKASVTFADNGVSANGENLGHITGKSVTISSASTATVTGRKNMKNGWGGISIGYIYNNSKVDLGQNLTVTANGTGAKDIVSITSTTNSKVSLECLYTSTNNTASVGVLLSAGTDFNTLNIDESVEIVSKKGIDIGTNSVIESKPFMTLSAGETWKYSENDVNLDAPTHNICMIGANVLVHENKSTINGKLTSAEGDINMRSNDKIQSSLTMNGSIKYTIPRSPVSQKKDNKPMGFLKEVLFKCFSLDLGFVKLTLDDFKEGGFDEFLDGYQAPLRILPTFTDYQSKIKAIYNGLIGVQDEANWVKYCYDISLATDIVSTNNTLTFGGKATATQGSVTLGATTSIEAACGAETSIVGIPAKTAVTVSCSVPVVVGSTYVKISDGAEIWAGKDISVDSSTTLPMSFDIAGWRNWKDAVKSKGAQAAVNFIKAVRESLKSIADYKDNGEFGVLDSLTSSHASTIITNTASRDGYATAGAGNLVVDVRNLKTATTVGDGAKLTAGQMLSLTSSSKGTQVTVSGKLPVFLAMSFYPYWSSQSADSSYGLSAITGVKSLNTVTYVGAATLEAGQLCVDSLGDAFMMELSLGATIDAGENAAQGCANIMVENKMTVSEISNGATIRLGPVVGPVFSESSIITATDKSTLMNFAGLLQGANGSASVGVGAAITVNHAFAAALLGNQDAIAARYADTWKSMVADPTITFIREDLKKTQKDAITLTLKDQQALRVEARDQGFLLDVGIAGAWKKKELAQLGGTEWDEAGDEAGNEGSGSTVAANVGVIVTNSDTAARQYKVNAAGGSIDFPGGNDITTRATEKTTIISVAADADINGSGEKDTFTMAGSLSVNAGRMNTTANVTDSNYALGMELEPANPFGKFTVDTSNTATVVAVDVAVGVGAATAGISAGSAFNGLIGNTASLLSGGNVLAENVSVTSLTDLTSFSLSLGAGVDLKVNITPRGNSANEGGENLEQDISDIFKGYDAGKLENNLEGGEPFKKNGNDADFPGESLEDFGEEIGEEIGEDFPEMLDDNGVSFDVGAAIARNALSMNSSAIVEGCTVTTPGELKVTAADTSVITAISLGGGIAKGDSTAIGSGGVFSFAPVSSTTTAAIRQKEGTGLAKLKINAGSLTLHATDNHRMRLWSIGGGYGETAGIGMVLSWGSFAGAITLAEMKNVEARIGRKADILASSDLNTTFISTGASGSNGYAAVTGMVNIMKFNNQVLTQIKDSNLTIDATDGDFHALSNSNRKFTDGVGALSVGVTGLKPKGSVGASVSLVYVGGNGSKDSNLTEMMVNNSTINNSGTTELLATSTTNGIAAGLNSSIAAGFGGGFFGLALSGSFTLMNDSSFTQVNIKDTYFNKRDAVLEADKGAVITAEATSKSALTFGFGTLDLQIGSKAALGAAIGASAGVLKDNATTAATMTGGGVGNAGGFMLHASGRADLTALIIGIAGSGKVGFSGGGLGGTINHQVTAYMEDSDITMDGALTIKADNTSNLGKDKGPRFTVANGALGLFGGSAGFGLTLLNVTDFVQAKAHNVSVQAGSMDVLANEYSSADTVTVNVAGGQFAGLNLTIGRVALRGVAEAAVTADKEKTADGKIVGITTSGGNDRDIASTGDLRVQAYNDQWLRSHVWVFAVTVNPQFPTGAVNICTSESNMAGTANAMIKGAMPLTVGGDLIIDADTNRYLTSTTVPVAVAVSLIGFSGNVDFNTMRVSNNTESDSKKRREEAARVIDKEILGISKLIENANIQLNKNDRVALQQDVQDSMTTVHKALDNISTAPKTTALLDLGKTVKVGGKDQIVAGTANVFGDAVILATDTINTEPVTVNVTGSMMAIGYHTINVDMASTVESTVNGTILNTATGDIDIDAAQRHGDIFRNVGVTVGGGAVTASLYTWRDTANTTINLGEGTRLDAAGAVRIATDSFISENYQHVNVSVTGINVAFVTPTYHQEDSITLAIGKNVSITANGAVTIKNKAASNFESKTFDVSIGIGNFTADDINPNLTSTLSLTTGEGVAITGSTVDILQEGQRDFFMETRHISASGLGLSFPYVQVSDTMTSTLSIGDGNVLTARDGALTIASDVVTKAELFFMGSNGGGINISVAGNSYNETITNKTKLGKNVKLRAKGDTTVRATNKYTSDMSGNNISVGLAGGGDLTTKSIGGITSDVSIGTGFEATGLLGADKKPTMGKSLTLEASNTDKFLYTGEKVTISLLVSPYSKNRYWVQDKSDATVTLDGGKIDVAEFNTKALTDVAVEISQILAGGSITVDVNLGAITTKITPTAKVTLGTNNNELDILTDNVSITANNKYRIVPRGDARTLVVGAGFGLVSGTSAGEADTQETVTATVTLGKGARIRRRADAAHYMKWEDYKAIISATNDVENDTIIELRAFGALNSNSRVTTWNTTTAYATLNINGTIDTWGNTDLTAYSHVKHNMVNSVITGALIGTYYSSVINTITATDTVNINAAVESIGNITIQSGSTGGRYKMVDGNCVLAGDDDTNSTGYAWGGDKAVISNKRRENLNIAADVRAGGELAIYNDSSANTDKTFFTPSGNSAADYPRGVVDTAAEVDCTVSVTGNLYAGLSSAVSLGFYVIENQLTPVLFSAQRILDGSENTNGMWMATGSGLLQPLYRTGKENNKDRLYVNPLTLPGMAFRIESKAKAGVAAFKDHLYSPEKHGLDIFFADTWRGDAQTEGVVLRGYETGLIFNRQAQKGGVKAIDDPHLYLQEGVSIRSQAEGNLYITGRYDFPYSTFMAKSEHDLIVSGSVNCGNIVFEAGGNYTYNDTKNNFGIRGAQAMYTPLLEQWEAGIPKKIRDHADDVIKHSGKGGTSGLDNKAAVYKPEEPYTTHYSEQEVKKAIPAVDPNNPQDKSSISASGTVKITAKFVDINGSIYSGIANSDMVIDNNFQVLAPDGKTRMNKAQADQFAHDHPEFSVFKLDGYTGVSLTYDAKNKCISLNSLATLECGITIDGIIVNSDPTGNAGLYVAGSYRDIGITNKTGLDLNIGNVDLTTTKSSGITLINRGTGKTTTYTPGDHGEWVMNVTNVDGNDVITFTDELGAGPQSMRYDGVADYQVKLERATTWNVQENGRLTFNGSAGIARRGTIVNDGKVGTKKTIIDNMTFDFKDPNSKGALTVSYVAADKAKHPDGFAISVNTLSDKRLSKDIEVQSGRNKYELVYKNTSTAQLYVSAANPIGIHLGNCSSSGSNFQVASGNVNFTGTLNTSDCTVVAGNAITAGANARINCGSVNMRAQQGSIGTGEGRLAFNADTASFSAGEDLYLSNFNTDGRKAVNLLALMAGQSIDLRSEGTINSLDLKALSSANIEAAGQIKVTDGCVGSSVDKYLGRLSLNSQNGGISVTGGDFTHGILTVTAAGDIDIVSNTADAALTLDYVESRKGNVSIYSPGGIYTVRAADMSNPKGVSTFGTSTSFEEQSEAARQDLADDYYAKLLYYERLYYQQDERKQYINRDEEGAVMAVSVDERETELKSLYATFDELYSSGQGDYLGDVMMELSGTQAVEGATFGDKAAALSYLAAHSDKLHNFAEAYYDLVMQEITREIREIYVPNEKIKYGLFNEDIYRLYWLRNSKGELVNQREGKFISPLDFDGQPMFDKEMCEAITAQFAGQAPARGEGSGLYVAKNSALLKKLANAASGYTSASILAEQVKDGPAVLTGGKPIGDMQPTIKAQNGAVTLYTDENHSIGGNAFHFTIKPIAQEDGKFQYSEWAQAFLADTRRNVWEGVQKVENKATGEYYVTLSSMSFSASRINTLVLAFLQHAVPMDSERIEGMNLYTVKLRNYFGVEAQNWKFEGGDLLLAVKGDVELSNETIKARNLFLSSTGSITGSLTNTAGGFVNLYADKGIGSGDTAFNIGGSSVFTLGSTGDVFLNVTGNVSLGTLNGGHVSIDARKGKLTPTLNGGIDVVAKYVDYYGALDTGLSFRTTGTSLAEGGLHWHGGNNPGNLSFSALNTAYTFWFVNENQTPVGTANIRYSGHFVDSGLVASEGAAFCQVGKGTGGHVLEFTGDRLFGDLALQGEGSYTVLSPGKLTLTSSSAIDVGGDATLRLAGVESAAGNPITLGGTGNLHLTGYAGDSPCEVKDTLVVDSTGDVALENVRLLRNASIKGGTVTLADVSAADRLVLDGRRGISGVNVASPTIVANSSNGGVFLNADTEDLSGSSWNSFVVDLECLGNDNSVNVHDITANAKTARVVIRSLSNELELDGTISGAALLFYSTGDILKDAKDILDSDYPFLDIWLSNDPEVEKMNMGQFRADLPESFVWLMEESGDDASKSGDDAGELRRKVDGEYDIPTLQPLRFTDKDGNTVSREQYANLISNK